MNRNDRRLLLDMMDDFGDALANESCNDWAWPKTWNEGYKKDFLERLNSISLSDVEEYHPKYGPPNWLVWQFLTYLVSKEIK